MKLTLALLASVILPAAALAQQASPATQTPPEDQATTVEEVVVQAPSASAIAEYVGELSVEDAYTGQLAVFDRRICPGVLNMRPEYAQAIIDRVALAAYQVGLRVGEPGCRADIRIIATRNAAEVVAAMIDENARIFSQPARWGLDGPGRLRAFRESTAPVRWWHITQRVDEGGSASRIFRNSSTEIRATIIVVDLDRLGTVDLATLGDYIAMVALAQLDPAGDHAHIDTVLNLFASDAPAVTGLTPFDLNYLRALYDAPETMGARGQRSQIVWQMMRDQEAARRADD